MAHLEKKKKQDTENKHTQAINITNKSENNIKQAAKYKDAAANKSNRKDIEQHQAGCKIRGSKAKCTDPKANQSNPTL